MMENNADLQYSQQLFAAVLDGNIDNQAFICLLYTSDAADEVSPV